VPVTVSRIQIQISRVARYLPSRFADHHSFPIVGFVVNRARMRNQQLTRRRNRDIRDTRREHREPNALNAQKCEEAKREAKTNTIRVSWAKSFRPRAPAVARAKRIMSPLSVEKKHTHTHTTPPNADVPSTTAPTDEKTRIDMFFLAFLPLSKITGSSARDSNVADTKRVRRGASILGGCNFDGRPKRNRAIDAINAEHAQMKPQRGIINPRERAGVRASAGSECIARTWRVQMLLRITHRGAGVRGQTRF